MAKAECIVREAQAADFPHAVRLLREARRRYVAFGDEDPGTLLREGLTFVAKREETVQGVLVVQETGPGWGLIRGLALAEGWSAVHGVRRLVDQALPILGSYHVHTLYCLLSAPWLHSPLVESGFRLTDRIVVLVRSACHLPSVPGGPARLRWARPHELDQVAALDAAAFPAQWHYSRAGLATLIASGARISVALVQDQIVGYVCVHRHESVGHIVRLAVHPAHRRRGIGRQLLVEAMAYLERLGVARLTVNTQQSNRHALRLYESLGFRPYGRSIPVVARPVGVRAVRKEPCGQTPGVLR